MITIKRDETNTKVINREEVINFINNCYYLKLLENYLSQLNEQTKVDKSEVQSIIDALYKRINEIKSFINSYENIKENNEELKLFYESNIAFINGIIDNYNREDLDKRTMKILIDFLRFCVTIIKNNEINHKETQMSFERFYSNNKYLSDLEYGSLLKSIYDEYILILNKVDENSMNYVENNYNLDNDHDITELGSGAFIATTVILEATALIGFIIGLFMLVK